VSVNEDAERVRQDPAQEQEWLWQLSLTYGALIGIGVVMVAPFLTAASLDLSAKICVVAFSVARAVAQLCAFVGVVAGFWHILWIAGVRMLAGGLAGVAVQSVGYWHVERDRQPPPREAEEPGDTES
jgi:hypothetical protein